MQVLKCCVLIVLCTWCVMYSACYVFGVLCIRRVMYSACYVFGMLCIRRVMMYSMYYTIGVECILACYILDVLCT